MALAAFIGYSFAFSSFSSIRGLGDRTIVSCGSRCGGIGATCPNSCQCIDKWWWLTPACEGGPADQKQPK